jgi:hypothetical protein
MSAVKAIRALLVASDPVTAIVASAKIVAGVVPQATVLPAISITHISAVELAAIDAQADYALVTSRVQVTVMAKDYPAVKAIIGAVRKACNYQRGTIAGVSVVSIVRDTVGPDFANDDATIYYQTIDFKITYHEPN